MKLSDLSNFSLETDNHNTGGKNVQLFILEDTLVDAGLQRQLDSISLVAKGKTEEDATNKGIDFALEVLDDLKGVSDIVRVGVRELAPKEPKSDVFRAKIQLGLFNKAENNSDLVVKKGYGFGEDKDIKKAQNKAIESALKIMGVR